MRWNTCSLCEQEYHGVVRCALGWACWKTYVGRLEGHMLRNNAMTELGNGLSEAKHHTDALIVIKADLAMRRRLGTSEHNMLIVQGNLANIYDIVGRQEEALDTYRDVYSKKVGLYGEEDRSTSLSANNYADSLLNRQRFGEAKALMRKKIPVAQRVLGESHELTLQMLRTYACALCEDPGATLGDLRKAVTTLEETTQTARRVFGNSHPLVAITECTLRNARAVLGARFL